jgi:hypothetical protein
MDIALVVVVVLGLVLGIYKFWSVTTQPVVAVLAIAAGTFVAGFGAAWIFGIYLATGEWRLGGSLLFGSPMSAVVGGASAVLVGIVGIVRYKLRRRRLADQVK